MPWPFAVTISRRDYTDHIPFGLFWTFPIFALLDVVLRYRLDLTLSACDMLYFLLDTLGSHGDLPFYAWDQQELTGNQLAGKHL
jgi:hypothetical protein